MGLSVFLLSLALRIAGPYTSVRIEPRAVSRRKADSRLTRARTGRPRMSVSLSDPTILLAGVVLALFQFLAALPWL